MTRHLVTLADITTRLRTSGRRAFEVMRRRDWLVVIAACTGGLLLFATLLIAQLDAYRARSLATEQAQAQASIVADQRAAQSRRIDQLTEQLEDTRDQLRAQARIVGRQEQAIRDLSAQVDQLGGQPVASSVAPDREATRTARPTTAPTTSSTSHAPSSPRTSPKPTASQQPRPTPSHDGDAGPLGVCALLPLC